MYQPMANFPRLNKRAVATAPGTTSRHAISVSGNHLNKDANSAVRMTSEAIKLMTSPTAVDAVPAHEEKAARPVLMTSDTASGKPSARMPANETRYVRRYQPTLTSFGSSTFQ